MANDSIFKQCPNCRAVWPSRPDFLADPFLRLDGYGADLEEIEKGLLYFTHTQADCLTTMTFLARTFLDLYTGKVYPTVKKGSDECPQYCLKKHLLERCDVPCRYASVREVIQIIKAHPKKR